MQLYIYIVAITTVSFMKVRYSIKIMLPNNCWQNMVLLLITLWTHTSSLLQLHGWVSYRRIQLKSIRSNVVYEIYCLVCGCLQKCLSYRIKWFDNINKFSKDQTLFKKRSFGQIFSFNKYIKKLSHWECLLKKRFIYPKKMCAYSYP